MARDDIVRVAMIRLYDSAGRAREQAGELRSLNSSAARMPTSATADSTALQACSAPLPPGAGTFPTASVHNHPALA